MDTTNYLNNYNQVLLIIDSLEKTVGWAIVDCATVGFRGIVLGHLNI